MEICIRSKKRDGSRCFLEGSVDCGVAHGQLQLPSMVAWLCHECWPPMESFPFPPTSTLGEQSVSLGQTREGARLLFSQNALGWGHVSLNTKFLSNSSPLKCKELNLMPSGSNSNLKVALSRVAQRMLVVVSHLLFGQVS